MQQPKKTITHKNLPIIIRPLELGDEPALREFINRLSSEQTFIRLQGEQFTDEQELAYIQDFLDKMSKNEAVKLLAFFGEVLVGVCDIRLKELAERHCGQLGLVVNQDFRGQGVGRALLEETIAVAWRTMPTLEIIELTVFGQNNKAQSLYKSAGFHEYGRLPRGIKRRGVYDDDVLMYLSRDF